jgi:glycine/D-amino acid oxidase-like deaminating enzyme
MLALARACLKRRFPAMGEAPLLESRVCQYESTRDEHLIFDVHPVLENVWIVGGGSGHGFKHGPVIGELVADTVGRPTPRRIKAIPPDLRLCHVPSGSHF